MFIATDHRTETASRLRRAAHKTGRARDSFADGKSTIGLFRLMHALVDAHDHTQVFAPVLRTMLERRRAAVGFEPDLHYWCRSPQLAQLLTALDGAVAALQAHALAFEREPTDRQAEACQ